jgi:hypothetical protein
MLGPPLLAHFLEVWFTANLIYIAKVRYYFMISDTSPPLPDLLPWHGRQFACGGHLEVFIHSLICIHRSISVQTHNI